MGFEARVIPVTKLCGLVYGKLRRADMRTDYSCLAWRGDRSQGEGRRELPHSEKQRRVLLGDV
jgi:hypothetical protein